MTTLVRMILGDAELPPTVENCGVTPRPTPGLTADPEELERQLFELFEQDAGAAPVGGLPAQSMPMGEQLRLSLG